MSSGIIYLEHNLKEEIKKISLKELKEINRFASYVHDKMVPLLNEVIQASAHASTSDEAVQILIGKIRDLHAKIQAEKSSSETNVVLALGRQETLKEVLGQVSDLAQKEREALNKQRVAEIAEKIQDGTYDPDVPRKVGQRPESIKNIRAAKQTLFSGSSRKSDEDGD